MAKKEKDGLLDKIKGISVADAIDWNSIEEGNRENVRKYNEELKSDAIKMLKKGMSAEELMNEMSEQGWDDASPVYKIVKETIGEDGDEDNSVVKVTETTTIEGADEDPTKSFFKAMGKKHDEENHWFDYKPKNRDLSKNKNKHIIY